MTVPILARRWYLFSPALYLIVIVALLYAQFGGTRSQSQTIGALEVSVGVRRDLLGRDRIRDVSVVYDTLRVALTGSPPATLEDGAGAVERLRPTEVRTQGGGLFVTLADRVELTFRTGDHGLVVHARPLRGLPFPVTLTVPLRFDAGSSVTTHAALPLLWTETGTCSGYVSGPEGGSLNRRQVALRLTSAEGAVLLGAEPCSDIRDPYQYWFAASGIPGSPEAYEAGVARFVERSYPVWRSRILTPEADLLSQDRLLVSYLAEALDRGGYTEATVQLQGRIAPLFNAGRAASPLPSVYLGMPTPYLAAGDVRDTRVLRDADSRIGAGDPTVFSAPDLLATVLRRATPSLVQRLLALAEEVPVETAEAGLLLDLARFYADVETMVERTEGVRDRLDRILVERVLPSIRRTVEGSFFLPEPARPEGLDRTAFAGRLLIDSAGLLGRAGIEFVGRQCILSVLALASADGSLPATVRLEGAVLVRSAERLGSEGVYTYLGGARVPRQQTLTADLGSRAWLLTAAEIRELVLEGSTLRIAYAFPVARAHYMILRGVPAIQSLRLHGVPWRADAEYSRYSDGWWYEIDTQTLYLKSTQQREVEDIIVSFP